jgi:hypothetical protein
MKTERRWIKSVLAAAAGPVPALPWERGARRRPAAVGPRPVAADLAVRATAIARLPALAAR